VNGPEKLGNAARLLQRRAKESVAALQAEFRSGQAGDDTPPVPLWAGPRQQFDALLAALGRASARNAEPVDPADTADTAEEDESAMLAAVARIDWEAVRATTGERTSEATATLREMAARVDWHRLQPAASQVSSALIAAVAAGRLPIGGPIGGQVVRAIVNQGDLAKRVSTTMAAQRTPVPTDFGHIIDTSSRDSDQRGGP
jgi:hypothetical protein